jgi:formylglycine-generating enzyme required for sulfatase activity
MPETKKTPYLSDYRTHHDELHFSDFRSTLARIIQEADTPITIGVFGPWGSGKSSLLEMLRRDVDTAGLHKVRSTWITAWKYDRQEALWRAFILRVLDALYPRKDGPGTLEERPRYPAEELADEGQKKLVELLGHMEESIYRPVDWQELGRWTVNWWQAAKGGGKAAAEIAAAFLPGAGLAAKALDLLGADKKADAELKTAAQAFQREVKSYHRQQLAQMEQFAGAFQEALALAQVERLVVFVDDLDRCLPEKAIEVIEAIKLFLEVPHTVFVLGMDKEVVARGVEARYREWFQAGSGQDERPTLPIDGDSYLQKIIQVPFNLPPLRAEDLEGYIDTLEQGLAKDERLSKMTRAVLAHGLHPNPRQAKRAINIFRLLQGLVEARQKRPPEQGGLARGQIAWPLLAKAILIQNQWPELYERWRQFPTLLSTLEDEYLRRPLSEEGLVRGEPVEVTAAEQDDAVTAAARLSANPAQPARRGGILDEYLGPGQRIKYERLEKLLAYPAPDKDGQGQERARFSGLAPSELQTYLYLVSVAGESKPPEAEGVPEGPESGLLSGDPAIAQDALARVQERLAKLEAGQQAAQRSALQRQLLAVLQSSQRSALERVSAGNAIGALGDPRFSLERWRLPDEPRLGFVEIPAGRFMMGSDLKRDKFASSDEQPLHQLELPTFYLGRYPVTTAQYNAYLAEKGEAGRDESGRANHPVVNVSWHDAIEYCTWLEQKLRKLAGERDDADPFWQGLRAGSLHLSLPSEAEWEKAARGSADSRIYPWGDAFDADKTNCRETGIGAASPVGCFPGGASPYGLLDMSGNVWEWTRSLWEDYPYPGGLAGQRKREDLSVEKSRPRVLRGGAFNNGPESVRCAFRRGYYPVYGDWYAGFRVVVSLFDSGL